MAFEEIGFGIVIVGGLILILLGIEITMENFWSGITCWRCSGSSSRFKNTSDSISETYKVLEQLMSAFGELHRQTMNPDLIQETPDYIRGYQDGIRAASRLTNDAASIEIDNF